MPQATGTDRARAFSHQELMVIEAARRLRDGEVVFVGTGLPLLATALAQRRHAPGVVMVIESGVIAPLVRPTPISVSDPKVMARAMRLGTLREVLGGLLQRGLIDVGFLGGAQIDRHANINSTQIGPPGALRRRLPGSGGANDMASHCRRLLIIAHHERRRFPERCDYITSPGFLDGPGARQRAGLSPDFAVTVVTDLAVLESDPVTCTLRLTRLMPGVRVDDVLAQTGFRPEVAADVGTVAPPEAEDLRVLREELDPQRVYLRSDDATVAGVRPAPR
ncbi:MAG: CoA-transferase [Armatimonadota bacterium]|nr:CoA-transferase [Armatimonadota bacterium]MDR7534583.1 CoA-transferase [Armatimonadota bacterium]MDR7535031.1 CoA-transferase [Armatimonadota bacterium]